MDGLNNKKLFDTNKIPHKLKDILDQNEKARLGKGLLLKAYHNKLKEYYSKLNRYDVRFDIF